MLKIACLKAVVPLFYYNIAIGGKFSILYYFSYHENHPEKVTEIPTYKKIYYNEIITNTYEGYSFAFDEISYNRFYPIALLNGYDFGPADFSTDYSNNYEKKFATLKIEPNQK